MSKKRNFPSYTKLKFVGITSLNRNIKTKKYVTVLNNFVLLLIHSGMSIYLFYILIQFVTKLF